MHLKTSVLAILIVVLLSITVFVPYTNAQNIPGLTDKLNTESKEEDKQAVEEEQEPVYHKIPVQIGDNILLYIGDTSVISARQRSLDIVYKINKAIKSATLEKKLPVKIGIIESGDNYYIEISDMKVVEVSEIDTLVNNQEKEKLAQVWKSNIAHLMKNSKMINNAKKEENIFFKLGIFFIGLVLFIILTGFIRIQASKLIAILAKNLFLSIETILNKFKNPENLDFDPNTKPQQDIQDTLETEDNDNQETQSEEEIIIEHNERIKEKVDLLSKEIDTILFVFTSVIVFFAVIVYLNYMLYLLPGTHGIVANFTHLILSIFLVLTESLEHWLFSDHTWKTIARILLLLVISGVLIYFVRVIGTALENIIQIILEKDKARVKRIQTITKIIKATVNILISILALVLVLSELGVNITPFIAGAGIIGLAISFGSQSLVKDIINGIFILIENQFGIGDVVNINGIGGVVEDMTLRVTILRDLSGKAYVIPNGQITTVIVLTKGWSRMNLNIGIAYKEDIDTASTIMMDVAYSMKQEFPDKIIDEPELLGVDALNDSSVDIKIIMKTAPGDQWSVEREYRRRIKYAFDQHNIEIPFPHTTLYVPQPIGYEAKGNN